MMIYFVSSYATGDFLQANLQEVIQYVNSCKEIAVDTETTGLDPLSDKIIMLQIGDINNQYIIDARYVDLYPLKETLENPRITKILVNAKFDYRFLASIGIRLENVIDCMLQEKLLLGGKPEKVSLEALSKKYTNFSYTNQLSLFEETLSKDIRKEFTELGESEFSTSQILYGAYDVILPLQIHAAQKALLANTDMQFAAELENEYSTVLGDIENNGFYLDSEKWSRIGEKVKLELVDALIQLNNWLKDNGLSDYEGINWNSNKQVGRLFKELGVPIAIIDKKKTIDPDSPVMKDSVQRSLIEQYKKDFPIVKLYLTYKVLEKSSNTYGPKFLSNIHPRTGRIHSNYNQILNTGRMSSNSPNLQNIKRDSEYRKCFGPARPDYTLVVTDYAAQESRIMADMANERNMIDFFLNKGGDIHSFTATKMFKVEVSQEKNVHLRSKAKVLNFGIPYGMSEFKLAKDFSVPIAEARDTIAKWFKAYPGLSRHFEKMKSFVRKNGYIIIDPVTNRRYYADSYATYARTKEIIDYYKARNYQIPKFLWSKYYSALGKMEREAQNYPIQGQGASMTKYAAILFRRYIRDNHLWDRVMIVNIVHDEIVIECERDLVSEISTQIKWCMEEAGRLFCKKVPMIATPVITSEWMH
jgi:DNA polymerase-1